MNFKATVLTLSILSSAIFAQAGQINFHENMIPLAEEQPIEKVFVVKDLVAVRSFIKPCPWYPKDVYGDVYECHTDRATLSQALGDKGLLTASEETIRQLVLDSNVQFKCDTKGHPEKRTYQGHTVYLFVGKSVEIKK